MNYDLLSKINSPSDLKALDRKEVLNLADEVRAFLIENVSESGGHLASNLGVVELTLALHRVFDSPTDRIIFDVGHQSYVHKLLTGRREQFSTLRTPGGLSGFTSRRESPHDPYGAGHASTALSASLGFAAADALSGDKRYTVCVIGDGAYTGGMVHEALNNVNPDLPLIIVLNENGMSISENKGAFASYLSGLRVLGKYLSLKRSTVNALSRIPLIGKPLIGVLRGIKNGIKRLIYRKNYFEQLGLYCIGPIDGNDYVKCERALTDAKRLGKSVIVHLKTQKGKGYTPAEQSPDNYHNLTCMPCEGYRTEAVDELLSVADEDNRIVAVTAAMGFGTGLDRFAECYPDRYFDVGIAEAHALTFSSGLAAAGKIPFTAIYSTFLQRGYDSILHDIALQQLPVKLLIDRAGLAAADGATHHGIFDAAFLSHIPDITLLAPLSYGSLRRAVRDAVDIPGAVAIRYSTAEPPVELCSKLTHIGDGVHTDFNLNDIPEVIFVTYGTIAENVYSAQKILSYEGIRAGIVVFEQLKPLDKPASRLLPLLSSAKLVLICEEGIRRGGVAEALVAELYGKCGTRIRICAIDDSFASPESPCDIYDFTGLSAESLAREVRDNL